MHFQRMKLVIGRISGQGNIAHALTKVNPMKMKHLRRKISNKIVISFISW